MGLGLAAACCLAIACRGLVPAKVVVDAFNGGALDGEDDPWYSRNPNAVDALRLRMSEELGSAFFGQGAAGYVVGWLDRLAASDECTERYLHGPDGVATDRAAVKQRFLRKGCFDEPPPLGAVCSNGTADRGALARRADYIRLHTALARAFDVARGFLDERALTEDDVKAAARRAFAQTARYLASRKWSRSWDRPVTGLVVKGGAATGVFSAGVVWAVMNVIDHCVAEPDCARDGFRGFSLMSGTSTGATVVGAVDAFESGVDGVRVSSDPEKRCAGSWDRTRRIEDYLDWYLCSSMADLYCVRPGSVLNLARGEDPRMAASTATAPGVLDGALDFTGLARKVSQNYSCSEMENKTELVLNTVDFRTGRLYSLSDQDPSTLRSPWDVTKAVLASAALPAIVRPVYTLPVDALGDAGRFAYLDGGIRSELPVLSLVRRGVERVLVVSSDTSTTGGHAPLRNGLGLAARYIDISTGGVTEAELEHAQRRAAEIRLEEYEQCRAGADACKEGCNVDAICSGDIAHACDASAADGGAPAASDGGARPSDRSDPAHIVEQTWKMASVWRDPERVDGLPGYRFVPQEQRRLLLAGAEAARVHCDEILEVLGVPASWRTEARKWCVPAVPPTTFCKDRHGSAPVEKEVQYCANDDGPKPYAEERACACPHALLPDGGPMCPYERDAGTSSAGAR